MIIRGKLSKRAVVKEDGLRRVYLQERRFNTNKNLARATTKSKSETQTVSNGCVGREGRDEGFEECPNIRDLVE